MLSSPQCDYSCESGYNLNGLSNINCDLDGNWPAAPTCEADEVQSLGILCSSTEAGTTAYEQCEAAGQLENGKLISFTKAEVAEDPSSLLQLHTDADLKLPIEKLCVLMWMLDPTNDLIGSKVDSFGFVISDPTSTDDGNNDDDVLHVQLSLSLSDGLEYANVVAALFGSDPTGFGDNFDAASFASLLADDDTAFGSAIGAIAGMAEGVIESTTEMVKGVADEIAGTLSPDIDHVELFLVWKKDGATVDNSEDFDQCSSINEESGNTNLPFIALGTLESIDLSTEFDANSFADFRVMGDGSAPYTQSFPGTCFNDQGTSIFEPQTAGICQYLNDTNEQCEQCPEGHWQYNSVNTGGQFSCKALDCNATTAAIDDRTWWEKFPLSNETVRPLGACTVETSELSAFEKIQLVLEWVYEGLTEGFSVYIFSGTARFKLTFVLWSTIRLEWAPDGELSSEQETLQSLIPNVEFKFNPYIGMGTDSSLIGRYDSMDPTLLGFANQYLIHQFGGQSLAAVPWVLLTHVQHSFTRLAVDMRFTWPDIADLFQNADSDAPFEIDLKATVTARNLFGNHDETEALPDDHCKTFCSGLDDLGAWGSAFPEDGQIDYARSHCEPGPLLKYCYAFYMAKVLIAGPLLNIGLEGRLNVGNSNSESVFDKRQRLRHEMWLATATDVDKMRACAMMVASQQGHGVNLNPRRMWYHNYDDPDSGFRWKDVRANDWRGRFPGKMKTMWSDMFAGGGPSGYTGTDYPGYNVVFGKGGESDAAARATLNNLLVQNHDDAGTYADWGGALDDSLLFEKDYEPFSTSEIYTDGIQATSCTGNLLPIVTSAEECKAAATIVADRSGVVLNSVTDDPQPGPQGCTVREGVLYFGTGDQNPPQTGDIGICQIDNGRTTCNGKWCSNEEEKEKMCSMPVYRRAAYCKSFGNTIWEERKCDSEGVGCQSVWPSDTHDCIIDQRVLDHCDTIWESPKHLAQSMPENYETVLGQSVALGFTPGLLAWGPLPRPINRLFQYSDLPKSFGDKLSVDLEGIFKFKFDPADSDVDGHGSEMSARYQCPDQLGEVPIKMFAKIGGNTIPPGKFYDFYGNNGEPVDAADAQAKYPWRNCKAPGHSDTNGDSDVFSSWHIFLNDVYGALSPTWQTPGNKHFRFTPDGSGKVRGIDALGITNSVLQYIRTICNPVDTTLQATREDGVDADGNALNGVYWKHCAKQIKTSATGDGDAANVNIVFSPYNTAVAPPNIQHNYVRKHLHNALLDNGDNRGAFKSELRLPLKYRPKRLVVGMQLPDVNVASIICLLYGVDPEFSVGGAATDSNCRSFAFALFQDDFFSFDPTNTLVAILDAVGFFDLGIYGTKLQLVGSGTGCTGVTPEHNAACMAKNTEPLCLEVLDSSSNNACEWTNFQDAVGKAFSCGTSLSTTINLGILGQYPLKIALGSCGGSGRRSRRASSKHLYQRHRRRILIGNSTINIGDGIDHEYLTIGNAETGLQWRRRRTESTDASFALEVSSIAETFAIIFGDPPPDFIADITTFLDNLLPPSLDAAIIFSTKVLLASDFPDVPIAAVLPETFVVQRGLTFVAALSASNGCTDGDKICQFVVSHFGPDASMYLALGVGRESGSDGLLVSAAVGLGDIIITGEPNCPYGEDPDDPDAEVPCITCGAMGVAKTKMADLSLFLSTGGGSSGMGISVSMSFETANRGHEDDSCLETAMVAPVTFTGSLAAMTVMILGVPTPVLEGSLAMSGIWYEAFGLEFLHFVDLALGVTLNPPNPVPSGFEGAGTVALGTECYQRDDVTGIVSNYVSSNEDSELACISASVSMGINALQPKKNYFSLTVTNFNVGSIIRTFTSATVRETLDNILPESVKESGFVGDASFSFASMNGVVDLNNNEIPSGLRILGTLNLMGWEVSADINIDPMNFKLYIDVECDPISIAGGFLLLTAAGPDGCVADGIPVDPDAYYILTDACAEHNNEEACLNFILTNNNGFSRCKWNAEGRGPKFFVNASLGQPPSFNDLDGDFSPYVDVLISGKAVVFLQQVEVYMMISMSAMHISVFVENILFIPGLDAQVEIAAVYGSGETAENAAFAISGQISFDITDMIRGILNACVWVMNAAKSALDVFVAPMDNPDGPPGLLTRAAAGLADLDQAIEAIQQIPLGCIIAGIITAVKSGFDALIAGIFNLIDPDMEIDSLEDFLNLIVGYGQDISENMENTIAAVEDTNLDAMFQILSFSAGFAVQSGPSNSSLNLNAEAWFFGHNAQFDLTVQTNLTLQDFKNAVGDKLLSIVLPVIDWVNGAITTVTDSFDNIMSKLVIDCQEQCQADFLSIWNNGVKPIADGFLWIIEGLGIVFNYILTGVQFVIEFIDNVIGGIEQHGGEVGQALINGFQLHKKIGYAVQAMLGVPSETSELAECYEYDNNNELYPIKAGKLCQYPATLDGLILALDDFKDSVTTTLADLNFPELHHVGFTLDFSDITNPAVALTMLLYNDEAGTYSEWGFSVGGASVRRAREVHDNHVQRNLASPTPAARDFKRQVLAFGRSMNQNRGTADGEVKDVDEYTEERAKGRSEQITAMLRESHAHTAGDRVRRDCEGGGDIFWGIVEKIAPKFAGLQDDIEPLEAAFNDAFGGIIKAFNDLADLIPNCVGDNHCQGRCETDWQPATYAKVGPGLCKSLDASGAESHGIKVFNDGDDNEGETHEDRLANCAAACDEEATPLTGGTWSERGGALGFGMTTGDSSGTCYCQHVGYNNVACTFNTDDYDAYTFTSKGTSVRQEPSNVTLDANGRAGTYDRVNCFCSVNAGLQCSWRRPNLELCRWDKDCISEWCEYDTSLSFGAIEPVRRCRPKAGLGQYCGTAGTGTTTNNQHCYSNMCGQYQNNAYKCCSTDTVIWDPNPEDWCTGLSNGDGCKHHSQVRCGTCFCILLSSSILSSNIC